MDIWIRSQNGASLVSGVKRIYIHMDYIKCDTEGEEFIYLGKYTRGRTVEIITEIECKIKESYEQGATYMIYDMPKE